EGAGQTAQAGQEGSEEDRREGEEARHHGRAEGQEIDQANREEGRERGQEGRVEREEVNEEDRRPGEEAWRPKEEVSGRREQEACRPAVRGLRAHGGARKRVGDPQVARGGANGEPVGAGAAKARRLPTAPPPDRVRVRGDQEVRRRPRRRTRGAADVLRLPG